MAENTSTAVIQMPGQALEIVDPAQQLGFAKSVAQQCKEIATECSVQIGKKRHIEVEAWQAIAIAHGCVASSVDVERTESGYKARGIVKRISDDKIISEAEGFVGDDESTWANRTEHANRAFAQTRAISRACRSAFAHVVVMMRGGFSTTPAEEMPKEGETGEPVRRQAPPTQAKPATSPPVDELAADSWRRVKVPFGKNKGTALGELGDKSLEWYCENYVPKPYNGKISPGDEAFRMALDAAQAELKAKSLESEATAKNWGDEARQAVDQGDDEPLPF